MTFRAISSTTSSKLSGTACKNPLLYFPGSLIYIFSAGDGIKIRTDLKPLCEQYKLAVSGRKVDLQKRLKEFSANRSKWMRYVLYVVSVGTDVCLAFFLVHAELIRVVRIVASSLQSAVKNCLALAYPRTKVQDELRFIHPLQS